MNRFPNDRVNNFSDAIFAIAITLLILEVKAPTSDELSTSGLSGALAKLTPSFISLTVSFFVTALYWRAHLIHARFISSYDNKLLWLNLWLLLFVVALPFSTALYAKNFNFNSPFIFYAVNITAIGVFNYWMIRYIASKEKGSNGLTEIQGRWMKSRALPGPIVWLLSALLALWFPLISRFLFVTIFIINGIIDRRFKAMAALEKSEETHTQPA